MTPVRLNGTLLKALLKERYSRGVVDLQSHWDTEGGVDRSTVYRWMNGQLPRSRDDMLRLCGLLDVDPFCLIAPTNGDAAEAIDQLTSAFHQDRWKPALAFIKDFAGRRTEWPPGEVAKRHFGRSWVTHDLEHNPIEGRNYYAALEIRSGAGRDLSLPQAFHFAYRHPTLFAKRWLQYGFVTVDGTLVRLVHINGHVQHYELASPGDSARVETFFGPEPAIFRVASLHPFLLKRAVPEDSAAAVRFP